jgi:hypothetical protein
MQGLLASSMTQNYSVHLSFESSLAEFDSKTDTPSFIFDPLGSQCLEAHLSALSTKGIKHWY